MRIIYYIITVTLLPISIIKMAHGVSVENQGEMALGLIFFIVSGIGITILLASRNL